MKLNNKIEITTPKAYQRVGNEFILSGWINKDYFRASRQRISAWFVDINCFEFIVFSVPIQIQNSFISKFRKSFKFSVKLQFNQFNIPFIERVQGRIALKLEEEEERIYIPIIVSDFEIASRDFDPDVLQKHGHIGERIVQYKKDLKNYYEELAGIRERSDFKINVTTDKERITIVDIEDDEILRKLLSVLSLNELEFEQQYKFAKQAQEERRLMEKYREAITWRGPLARGTAHQWNGFKFIVHSNDHDINDKHFHIIHIGKGVDARISFPELKLISYDGHSKSISSKEEKEIIKIFQDPQVFKKMESEFEKKDKLPTWKNNNWHAAPLSGGKIGLIKQN